MFKKILIALTLFVLVFTLAACNTQGEKDEKGDDGVTPTIEISEDGYWVINGEKTDVKAKGEDGKDAEGSEITDENPQGLAFYPKDDGTYAVDIGYAKYLSKIEIPATYKGKPVTEVGRFSFNTSLKEIVIPDSVTTIGDYAFSDCSGLTSVTIPDSVTTIGYYAFEDCTGLTSVTLPNSITSIGYKAFSNCSGLTSITIPDSVTTIESDAFRDCSGLTSVIIGDSVTIIGDSAFYCCTSLTSVIIGDSVTTIGDYAFHNCDSLTSITIPDSVTSIGKWMFSSCSGLTNITIGDGVTTIGERAFYGCTSLTSVIFENISGWKSGDTAISSTELADSAKAAELLKSSYEYSWERS